MLLPSIKKQITIMMAGFAVSGESDMEITFLTSSALITGKVPNQENTEKLDASLLAVMAAKSSLDGCTVIEALNSLDVESIINANHLKETSDYLADRSQGRGRPFWDVKADRSENSGNMAETSPNDGFLTLTNVKIRSLSGDCIKEFPSFTVFFDQIAGLTLEKSDNHTHKSTGTK
jgi:hypothetical protein